MGRDVTRVVLPGMGTGRGVDNHSPNASRIQDWLVNVQTHSPVKRAFFPPLTDPFYIDWASGFLTSQVKILNYSPVW
jgi:hypothetical protein